MAKTFGKWVNPQKGHREPRPDENPVADLEQPEKYGGKNRPPAAPKGRTRGESN